MNLKYLFLFSHPLNIRFVFSASGKQHSHFLVAWETHLRVSTKLTRQQGPLSDVTPRQLRIAAGQQHLPETHPPHFLGAKVTPPPRDKWCACWLAKRETGAMLKRSISWYHYQSSPQDSLTRNISQVISLSPHPLPRDWNHSTQNGLEAAAAVPPKPPQPLNSEGYAVVLHSVQLEGFVFTDFIS